MLRVNLLDDIVRRQIRDTYEALSKSEQKAYDKKIRKEEAKRRANWETRPDKTLQRNNGKGKGRGNNPEAQGKEKVPPHVEELFKTPARLYPDKGEPTLVAMKKKEE